MTKHVLSILVENNSGVLSRVSGLFSRRGYNIESLSVGITEDKNISRITITTICDEKEIIQIQNQLRKLIDIIEVIELLPNSSVYREITLIKVKQDSEKMLSIVNIVNIFRANIIDVSEASVIIETTGDDGKIKALIDAMKPFGVLEIVRTGLTGLARGSKSVLENKEERKSEGVWQNYTTNKIVI